MQLGDEWRDVCRGVQVKGPEDIGDRLVALLRNLDQEAVIALFLGPDGVVRESTLVALGTCHRAMAEPRDFMRGAVAVSATEVILVHNHPSRSTAITPADVAFTRRAIAAGRILGIEVLDHVVIGGSSWRSLRESSDLWLDNVAETERVTRL